jgi:signal transduction histidine kinase
MNNMNLQLAPDIEISGDWQVVGENLRLERVLSNLVENAWRHSPPDSTVTVGLKEDEGCVLITVDDEGSGVPQDISKNLFQKFFQGKEKCGRAGLGLYFCRITVERWGGTIGYSPRSEGGSRFWVRLARPIVSSQ